MNVESERCLLDVLTAGGINIGRWGHGDAKSVADLWHEIQTGDARMECDPLVRCVSVVEVLIRHEGQCLMEVEQELKDGRRRHRRSLPSEKMRHAETPVDAVFRCLSEELRVPPQDVEILGDPKQPKHIEKDSPSYPGLTTKYTVYTVKARVEGLPDVDFWTREAKSHDGDPVVRHRWIWASDRDMLDGSHQMDGT